MVFIHPEEPDRMNLTATQLQEILQILTELDPDQVMEKIVKIMPRVFHSRVCALFLRDEDNENEIVLRKSSLEKHLLPTARIAYESGEGLTGWVFKNRRPLLIADLYAKTNDDLKAIAPDLEWKGKYADVGLMKPQSYLGAPLVTAGGDCLGVIRMSADDINFSEKDMELMMSFAGYIARAVEKSHLFVHERRKAQYFTLLTDIGTKLHTYYNRQDLLHFIARGCAETFSAETSEIYIRSDTDPQLLVLRAGHGIPPELINSATHRVGEGLTGHIVQEGKILRSRNVLTLPWYKGKYRAAIKDTLKYGDRLTFLGMPIKIKSDIIGCIKLYNKIPREGGVPFFTEDDEKFLAILVDMLAVALENLQYLESMQISAVKMMQIQRLTALGTLAIRVPNEISNPLTIARLNVINLLRALDRAGNGGGPPDPADLREKMLTIQQFLEEVAVGIGTLQEFSTKAGFIRQRRAWSDIIDESLLFLSTDLITKKVKISREKEGERRLPELWIEPNEGIEILVTLVKAILESIGHYDSEIAIRSSLDSAGESIVTIIEGRDNTTGTSIQSTLAGLPGLNSRNLFNPAQFALKVTEEIVRNNYGGRIETCADTGPRVCGFRLTLPIEKIQARNGDNG
jgi:GAF domain-containing protein